MNDPTLIEAVNEIQVALEGYTEDCIASDPAAQKALQQAWDLVRNALGKMVGARQWTLRDVLEMRRVALLTAARMDDLKDKLPEFYQGAMAADAQLLRESANRSVMQLRCGERLYLGGNLHAVCTQPGGTEHSHNDMDAQQAIDAGLARPVSASDRPHDVSTEQDSMLSAWPWQDAGIAPFSVHDLMANENVSDAKRWLDTGELVGLVEERNGGIIGYVNRAHVDRIAGLLNLAAMAVENEQ